MTEETEEVGCEGKKETATRKPNNFHVNATDAESEIAYRLSWECEDGSQGAGDTVSTNRFDNRHVSLDYMREGKVVSRYKLHIDLKKAGVVSRQIDKVYEIFYAGITKEEYENGSKKLEDYFNLGSFGDERIGFDEDKVEKGQDFPQYISSGKNYTGMDYILTAQAIDNPSLVKTVVSGNDAWSIPQSKLDFRLDFGDGVGKKQVDSYKLKIVFKYDGEEICTREAAYDVYFTPVLMRCYSTPSFRKGETKKLGVDVIEYGSTSKEIGDHRYQWYKGDTLLQGEDLSETYVKVEDYTVQYKCVFSATKLQQAYPDIVMKEISCVFDPTENTGYRLKDSSESEQRVDIGEPATLSIKYASDPGYSFDHKWERITQSSNGEESYIELSEKTDTLHIEKTTEEDLRPVYSDPDGRMKPNYQVTVTVYRGTEKKPETKIMDRTYAFTLTRRGIDKLPVEIDSNLEEVIKGELSYDVAETEIERGQDIRLYMTSAVNDPSYTVEKKWYKKVRAVQYVAKQVSGGDYICKKDTSGNNLLDKYGEPILEYEPEDPTEVPAGAKVIESLDVYTGDRKTITISGSDTEYRMYTEKVVTYGQEIPVPADGVYTMAGKDAAGAYTDNRGTYIVDMKTTQKDKEPETSIWAIRLVYDTDLRAYAKTKDLYAALGESVSLEVIASNKNASLYDISYQWRKKKRESDKEWIPLQDEKGSTYTIGQLKEDDYGIYEAIVSDPSDVTETVRFTVDRKEIVFHTPYTSVYRRSVGDSVTMEVKADIPVSTTVSYNWYRTDKYIDDVGGWPQEQDWQILNEEKPNYTFTVLNEEDFGTYRCEVRYRSDIHGQYKNERFYFKVIDAAKDIVLERTTPEIQYKRPGDSATYGVRYRADSPAVKDADIRYQWYDSEDEPIEGATGPTYTVDSLKEKDFGQIKCVLSYLGQNHRIRFTTLLYSDVVIDHSVRYVLKETGDDAELAVVIEENPADRKLTYQWYFGDSIIYGATDPTYKISKIGEEQFGTYRCKIYDGDYEIDAYEVEILHSTDHISVSLDSGSEVSAAVGQSVTFEVAARSNKNLGLSYQWYTDAGAWSDGSDGTTAIGDAVETAFTIKYVMPSMEGEYWCIVKDTEGHRVSSPHFTLSVESGLSVDSGYRYDDDMIGYSVKIGGEVTLMANAKIEGDHKLFYQWYKEDGGKAIYNATSSELRLTNITLDDLGYYTCVVSDGVDMTKTLNYYVYVDNGLVVEPSILEPRAAADGSIAMFVKAKANAGEKISYLWEKEEIEEGEEETVWEVLPQGSLNTYKIPKITKATLGNYRCTVTTSGEKRIYGYNVKTMYEYSQSREFAEKGDSIIFKADIINRATDAKYTYKWYAGHPETGSQKEVSNAIASYTAKAPGIRLTGKNAMTGYKPVDYSCEIIRDDEKDVDEGKYTLNVFPSVTYVKTLPKTSHPFNKRVDVQGYKVNGAKNIKITLDTRSETVLAVDAAGHGHWIGMTKSGKIDTLTLAGSKVIFVANTESGLGYGYEAKSIVDTAPKKPVVPVARPVPKKGTKHTVGSLIYKVTKSSAKAGTVAVTGVKKKTLTTAAIPKTVKISGYTFKVTTIDGKAFSNCKKLKKITIEVNIASIGKQVFKGCAKLSDITIKTTKLTSKKVGSQAFKGINAKATIKVPKKKLASYKKILKAKGVGKKAKIK